MKIRSLLKMLVIKNLSKFASILQIDFSEQTSNEFNSKKNEVLEYLSGLNLNVKESEQVDGSFMFECEMLPEIEKLIFLNGKIWAKFSTNNTEKSLDTIKNIISGLNSILENRLISQRVAIATNYNFNEDSFKGKKSSDEVEMKLKSGKFFLSSAQELEDNLNFNIIMQENDYENIIALDLFLTGDIQPEELFSKLEMLFKHSENDWSFEKVLKKINK